MKSTEKVIYKNIIVESYINQLWVMYAMIYDIKILISI